MREHRRDDHAAGLPRPRRPEQQHRPLGPREPRLCILIKAEIDATGPACRVTDGQQGITDHLRLRQTLVAETTKRPLLPARGKRDHREQDEDHRVPDDRAGALTVGGAVQHTERGERDQHPDRPPPTTPTTLRCAGALV